ncbi:unnamed protein product [Nesidiocoris tenuis]|uniref:Uncharacterized protein n=1 Tax=Nesidiocoris tenuis TaxID=355587 RepID=A0A6H5HD00_9HEMI|nr:unnamed protein product [Nesidiocoris tenuis]
MIVHIASRGASNYDVIYITRGGHNRRIPSIASSIPSRFSIGKEHDLDEEGTDSVQDRGAIAGLNFHDAIRQLGDINLRQRSPIRENFRPANCGRFSNFRYGDAETISRTSRLFENENYVPNLPNTKKYTSSHWGKTTQVQKWFYKQGDWTPAANRRQAACGKLSHPKVEEVGFPSLSDIFFRNSARRKPCGRKRSRMFCNIQSSGISSSKATNDWPTCRLWSCYLNVL